MTTPVDVELSNVVFPSRSGSFRVCVRAYRDLEFIRIWLESKQTKSNEAQYVFQINPIAIEKVVILEAQILDLQNSVRHLEAALQEKTRVVFSASSTKMVAPKNCVVWNNSPVYNDAYFDLSDDTTEVIIIERGLYEIQMTGRVHSWNDMVETVHCLVDGVCVAAAFVGESRLFGMNRVLLLEADARMMFVSCGKYNLEPGCSLSLVLVEEVPPNEEGVH
ncbi:hypothetical protein Ae201684P_000835 [Aphanomyces euteiches]|nr:hypothetical protein Ae201684P_000835 [Aphanomyces euteiches]